MAGQRRERRPDRPPGQVLMAQRPEPIDEILLLAALARAASTQDSRRLQSDTADEQRRDVPLGTADAAACAAHLGGVWARKFESARRGWQPGGVTVGGPSVTRVRNALRSAAKAGRIVEQEVCADVPVYELAEEGRAVLEQSQAGVTAGPAGTSRHPRVA
jgi:hypothetical protein